MQPGTYKAHDNFEPNNRERMKLPWLKEEIKDIFATTYKLYGQAMENGLWEPEADLVILLHMTSRRIGICSMFELAPTGYHCCT